MDEEHKRRLAEGRQRYIERMQKTKKTIEEAENMVFKKRHTEEEDEPPRHREERNHRIAKEIRGEPEYPEDDYAEEVEEEEYEPAPPKQRKEPQEGMPVHLTFEEMKADAEAHAFLVNTTAARFAGMPPHIAEAEMHRLCGKNIQRLKDLEDVLKRA